MNQEVETRNLPANKWVTVLRQFNIPRQVHWKVATDKRCKWRRIGFIPFGGKFTKRRSAILGFGIIQVRSPEATICASSIFSSVAVDNHHF